MYCSFNAFVRSNLDLASNRIWFKLMLTIVILSFSSTFFYFKLSNFWIGESMLDKFGLKTNILNQEANKIAVIEKFMEDLKQEIIKDPNNLEVILKLAETKFLLGYLEDALKLYKRARNISPSNVEVLKAETQIRVIIEKDNHTEETLELLNRILLVEPNNLLALYVLGNNEYKKKNFLKAKQMFKVLKGLLKHNSQEYNEVKNKLLEMERVNEKYN